MRGFYHLFRVMDRLGRVGEWSWTCRDQGLELDSPSHVSKLVSQFIHDGCQQCRCTQELCRMSIECSPVGDISRVFSWHQGPVLGLFWLQPVKVLHIGVKIDVGIQIRDLHINNQRAYKDIPRTMPGQRSDRRSQREYQYNPPLSDHL